MVLIALNPFGPELSKLVVYFSTMATVELGVLVVVAMLEGPVAII